MTALKGYENIVEYDDSSISMIPGKTMLTYRWQGGTVATHICGDYNYENIVAALTIGEHFKVALSDMHQAISEYTPSNNRSQITNTAKNTLIMDAYNANPSSMAAALDSFSLMESGSKIALLGDMRELGDNSVHEHVKVVNRIAESDFKAYLVGEEFAKALAETGGCANVLGHYATSDELASYLNGHAISGSCVPVKGSRGIQMEKVIPSL